MPGSVGQPLRITNELREVLATAVAFAHQTHYGVFVTFRYTPRSFNIHDEEEVERLRVAGLRLCYHVTADGKVKAYPGAPSPDKVMEQEA